MSIQDHLSEEYEEQQRILAQQYEEEYLLEQEKILQEYYGAKAMAKELAYEEKHYLHSNEKDELPF